MSVTRNMELRHLNDAHILQLSRILDNNDSWSKLMEKIPKDLTDIQQSETDFHKIQRKYSTENIKCLERESQLQKRSPTTILFEEWGTSGRKRATVNDLLELLIKVDLYRAADFVATSILNEDAPPRPTTGPGAKFCIDLPEAEIDEKAIAMILDNVQYPNSSAFLANDTSMINNNNRDYNVNPDVSVKNHVKVKTDFFLGSEEELSSSNENQSDFEFDPVSDLMKFSKSSLSTTSHNQIIMDNINASAAQQFASSQYLPEIPSLVSRSNGLPIGLSHLENECAYPSSSLLQISAKQYEDTMSSMDGSGAQLNSFLLPDIDDLQIREQTISFITDKSTELMSSSSDNDNSTVETIPLRNESVYIPNVSLLNGS